MLKPEFIEEENYKAKLRREESHWRSNYDRVLLSDRAAVDIGLVGLRTVIAANAGAIVALLAFMGPVWSKSTFGRTAIAQIVAPILPFIIGLVLAMLCCLVAYLYQSLITEKFEQILRIMATDPYTSPAPTKVSKVAAWFGLAMLILGVASLCAFVVGVCILTSHFPT